MPDVALGRSVTSISRRLEISYHRYAENTLILGSNTVVGAGWWCERQQTDYPEVDRKIEGGTIWSGKNCWDSWGEL
jgi:hypothetical protein